MTSFGAIPIKMKNIDFLMSNSCKSLQGVPGVSFIIAKREMLQKYVFFCFLLTKCAKFLAFLFIFGRCYIISDGDNKKNIKNIFYSGFDPSFTVCKIIC